MQGLLKYDIERRRKSLQELDAIDDPREAISKFFDRVVQHSLNDKEKKGCLLVNTSLEYPQHNEEVQKVVADAFKEIAAYFEKQIKRGQERGDISEAVEPRPTAKALIALVIGIRVMGRGTFGKAALQQIAEQAKRLIS